MYEGAFYDRGLSAMVARDTRQIEQEKISLVDIVVVVDLHCT